MEAPLPHVISEWTEQAMLGTAAHREAQIRLVLQPRPRWLPEWAWRRLVARLLVIEERL